SRLSPRHDRRPGGESRGAPCAALASGAAAAGAVGLSEALLRAKDGPGTRERPCVPGAHRIDDPCACLSVDILQRRPNQSIRPTQRHRLAEVHNRKCTKALWYANDLATPKAERRLEQQIRHAVVDQ